MQRIVLVSLLFTLAAVCPRAAHARYAEPGDFAGEQPACNAVMSEEALCKCISLRSFEDDPASCELAPLVEPDVATLRTAGGDLYVVARKGEGWYEVGRLHSAGLEDFALRSARVETAGDLRVVRLVTWTQIGSSEWMHTANQVVLCPLVAPNDPRAGCASFPLYAHTREMVSDVASERESKFRVALTTDGSVIVQSRGPLEHPELRVELGEKRLRKGGR
jgi:hypothetical protein